VLHHVVHNDDDNGELLSLSLSVCHMACSRSMPRTRPIFNSSTVWCSSSLTMIPW